MPYLICVNKPGNLPETDPTAAATLVDAIEAAEAHIDTSQDALGEEEGARRYFEPARRAALAMGPDGGVISLPDGYVIDVTRISGLALIQRVVERDGPMGMNPKLPDSEKVRLAADAYNRGAA